MSPDILYLSPCVNTSTLRARFCIKFHQRRFFCCFSFVLFSFFLSPFSKFPFVSDSLCYSLLQWQYESKKKNIIYVSLFSWILLFLKRIVEGEWSGNGYYSTELTGLALLASMLLFHIELNSWQTVCTEFKERAKLLFLMAFGSYSKCSVSIVTHAGEFFWMWWELLLRCCQIHGKE